MLGLESAVLAELPTKGAISVPPIGSGTYRIAPSGELACILGDLVASAGATAALRALDKVSLMSANL